MTMQKIGVPILRSVQHRLLSTSALRYSSWSPGPSPPKLPKEEQEIFDKLVKQSTGAFSTPRQKDAENDQSQEPSALGPEEAAAMTNELLDQEQPQARQSKKRRTPPIRVNQSPHSEEQPQISSDASTAASAKPIPENQSFPQPRVKTGSGEELHPNIRRGAPPEFEGDINPKTGETGGPKNEPLRWGHTGDWSYNGRVSDF